MPGPPFARNLVAAGDVDDVDGVVGEVAAELRRQIVAAALHEQQLGVKRRHQAIERLEILADIVADRGVRAAAGLDGGNPLGRQRVVTNQELGVLPGEDVVGDDGECGSARAGDDKARGGAQSCHSRPVHRCPR